jgi:hypothetical protein
MTVVPALVQMGPVVQAAVVVVQEALVHHKVRVQVV